MVAPMLGRGRYWIGCGVLGLASAIGILPAYGNRGIPVGVPQASPPGTPAQLPALDRRVEQQVPGRSPLREIPQNPTKPILPVRPPVPVPTPVPVEDELGVLQPRPIPSPTPEPAKVNPANPSESSDSGDLGDLGDILIRPQPPVPPKPKPQPVPKSLYLIGRLDYFNNSNVLAAPIPQTDGALRAGLSLYYAPSLGPKTFLLATTEAAMLRYGTLSRLNSDELRLKVGVYHQWTPKVSTEIGWSYYELSSAPAGVQQVFQGKRFFNEHSLRFDLIRQDELTKNLNFTSIYQFRWNLAGDVEQYDRLVNNAIVSLSYKLSPRTQAAIDYQYSWTHFIQQTRDDQTHFLGVRFSHSVNDRLQLSTFGGRNFGNSSEPRVNPVGWIFGFGLGVNLPIL